jgi:D-alanine transfer protein
VKTRKGLFYQGGPFLIAILIVVLVFVYPNGKASLSAHEKERVAVSSHTNVLIGNYIKNATMEDKMYIPYFGSSELRRIDEFHPSVLAKKYDRDYRPFLFGKAGTQSLTHYGFLISMKDELRGKKAIFIVSPQWFVPGGVPEAYFKMYFSPLQMYDNLIAMKKPNDGDRYYATRLLRYGFIQQQSILCDILREVEKGVAPKGFHKLYCQIQYELLMQEDQIYGRIGIPQRDLKQYTKGLPDEYSLRKLDELARRIGEASSTNNDFQIKNSFYKKRLSMDIKRLHNAQKSYDYTKSLEFGDFELVLSKMAELDMDVLFILPPVNGLWSDYTGFSQDMLQEWAKKIRFQLEDQGFTNILDLTTKYREDYFMQDTIHLGWRGWVAIDERSFPFLENKTETTRRYEIKKSYFEKEWANQ